LRSTNYSFEPCFSIDDTLLDVKSENDGFRRFSFGIEHKH